MLPFVGLLVFLMGMTLVTIWNGFRLGPTLAWIVIPTILGGLAAVTVILALPSGAYLRAVNIAAAIGVNSKAPYVVVVTPMADARRALRKLDARSTKVPRYSPVSVSADGLVIWTHENARVAPAATIPASIIASIQPGRYGLAGPTAWAIWIRTTDPEAQFPLIVLDSTERRRPKGIYDAQRLKAIAERMLSGLQSAD